MPVTMGTAITEVRSLLAESVAAYWSNDQLASWINQGCSDIARRAETLWQEVNINVVPGVQLYQFPPDFLNCHRAEFSLLNSDQTYNVDFHPLNEMDAYWGILHNLPAAWPEAFTIRGNSVLDYFLMLYPAPAAPGTLTVYYYRQAVAVAADDTTTPIDTQSGWEDIVYDYAVYKARRSANDATWQEAYQLYEKNLAQLIDKTRQMTDQGGKELTSGANNWPTYLYGDGW